MDDYNDIYGNDGDDYGAPSRGRGNYDQRSRNQDYSRDPRRQDQRSRDPPPRDSRDQPDSYRSRDSASASQAYFNTRGQPIASLATQPVTERNYVNPPPAFPPGGGHGPHNALTWNDMHWYTSDADVKVACAQAGVNINFSDVCFQEHKVNGKSKGIIYVEFASERDAQAVRQWFENNDFQGKRVVPDIGASLGRNPFATLPKDSGRTVAAMRGRGRGGYQGGGGRGGYNNNNNQNYQSQGGSGGLPQLPAMPPNQLGYGPQAGGFGGMMNPMMMMQMQMAMQQQMMQQQNQSGSDQPPAKRSRED